MLAVVAAAVLVAASGSWVDSDHGWDARPDCHPFGYVCSTENGGRTWHGIYVGGLIGNFVRTSVTAGAVGDQEAGTLWTRDNGRHWYRTTRLGSPYALWRADPGRFYAGAGNAIRLVEGWPFRGRARCRGHWSANTGGYPPGTGHGRLPRNVCIGAAVNARLRLRKVVDLGDTYVDDFAVIPGGVAGMARADARTNPDALSFLRLFVWKNGSLQAKDVRVPAHTRLDSDFFVFTAHWPDLWAATIVGPDDRGPQSRGIVEHEVVFHSSDGRASWSVDG